MGWRRRRCGGISRRSSIAAWSSGATAPTASATRARTGEGRSRSPSASTLAPLVARAEEFEAWAEEVRAEERALKLVRERITLCRRDIAKMIATGHRGGRADAPGRAGARRLDGGPHALSRHTRPDSAHGDAHELEPIAEELSMLADEVLTLLENHVKTKIPSANESQTERHIQNSNPNSPIDLEPASRKSRGRGQSQNRKPRGCRKGPSR